MKKAIITRSLLITVIVLMISSFIGALTLQKNKEQDVYAAMHTSLQLALKAQSEQAAGQSKAETMSHLLGEMRITVINATGKVVGDSHMPKTDMENHSQRPEIQLALEGGVGQDSRRSQTLQKQMLYVAVHSDSYVYRLSQPLENLGTSFLDILPSFLVGILLALVVTPLLAKRIMRDILKPLTNAVDSLKRIEQGDYSVQLSFSEYDELVPVMTTVNRLTRDISLMLEQLSNEKQKTEKLLDSMEQGLVLVDHNLKILLLNAKAKAIFGQEDAMGQSLIHLTCKTPIVTAVCQAVDAGLPSHFDMEQETFGIYAVSVAPMKGRWLGDLQSKGAVLLLTDVTDLRNTQKMKSEFVDNASHELKTPITSIRGFSELLYSGMVQDTAKQQEYLNKINEEACRMTNIIEDILRLSQLESGVQLQGKQWLPVAQIAQEVVDALCLPIQEKGLHITLNCKDQELFAPPEELRHLLGNLVENAVKYNKPQGSVVISGHHEAGSFLLSVKDSGIGIAPEHHARIFERFYRADKSRSRKIGGTGLGLSIVKHIVNRLGGEVFVRSEENIGTEILVKLPNDAPSILEQKTISVLASSPPQDTNDSSLTF